MKKNYSNSEDYTNSVLDEVVFQKKLEKSLSRFLRTLPEYMNGSSENNDNLFNHFYREAYLRYNLKVSNKLKAKVIDKKRINFNPFDFKQFEKDLVGIYKQIKKDKDKNHNELNILEFNNLISELKNGLRSLQEDINLSTSKNSATKLIRENIVKTKTVGEIISEYCNKKNLTRDDIRKILNVTELAQEIQKHAGKNVSWKKSSYYRKIQELRSKEVCKWFLMVK